MERPLPLDIWFIGEFIVLMSEHSNPRELRIWQSPEIYIKATEIGWMTVQLVNLQQVEPPLISLSTSDCVGLVLLGDGVQTEGPKILWPQTWLWPCKV